MAIYRLLQNLPMGPEDIRRMEAAYEQRRCARCTLRIATIP
jgi:hypothetical protein